MDAISHLALADLLGSAKVALHVGQVTEIAATPNVHQPVTTFSPESVRPYDIEVPDVRFSQSPSPWLGVPLYVRREEESFSLGVLVRVISTICQQGRQQTWREATVIVILILERMSTVRC